MTYRFTPAKRENIGLLIALAGGTGSGKTFSAMRLAHGISGERPFAVIDTENRRALHYADRFAFDHCELHPPFRPQAYEDAITQADKAGYPVIVVDSASHVWAGEGGCLDWQEEELTRMAGEDFKKRESCKMASWIKPKQAHKSMVNRLLQCRAHIILCHRAEEKIEMVKDAGKWVVRPKQTRTGRDGWVPVCEKSLPFEATCSFLLLADTPGRPYAIKLEEQHREIFPPDSPIDEAAGKRLAEWASGKPNSPPGHPPSDPGVPPSSVHPEAQAATLISFDQAIYIEDLSKEKGVPLRVILKKAAIGSIRELPADKYQSVIDYLKEREATQ